MRKQCLNEINSFKLKKIHEKENNYAKRKMEAF